MNLKSAGISHQGGKKVNEDSYLIFHNPPWECFLVADGLGGHGAGDVASVAAVEAVKAQFTKSPELSEESLRSYIQGAQDKILHLQQTNPRYKAMRTTLVLLISDSKQVAWAHVGDSRLYFFRDGLIHYQTLDHSVPQALVRAGEITFEQIRFHEDRNRLLQALGSESPPKTEVLTQPVVLQPGDAFLLCSDGFWEWIFESEMQQDLKAAATPGQWLESMVKRLNTRAKPGHDNYSAVGVFVS